MALFGFRKKRKNELDPIDDLVLSKLRVGYVLDYDMTSWQVTKHFKYITNEGDESEEWELKSGRDTVYLSREEDDEVEWLISRKIPIGAIEGEVKQTIIGSDEPPDRVQYEGRAFYLDETGAGCMYVQPNGQAQEYIYWDFIDESDERLLTIEQWGETEFEASIGEYVGEHQFDHILPGTL